MNMPYSQWSPLSPTNYFKQMQVVKGKFAVKKSTKSPIWEFFDCNLNQQDEGLECVDI